MFWTRDGSTQTSAHNSQLFVRTLMHSTSADAYTQKVHMYTVHICTGKMCKDVYTNFVCCNALTQYLRIMYI